jgi:hypothetical protein
MMRMVSHSRRLAIREELRLRQWQAILACTRLAGQARRWAALFNRNRSLMALAFLIGVLLGLLPLLR